MTPTEKAAILQDEGFLSEVRVRLQVRLFNEWINTTHTDVDKREALYLEAQAAQEGIQQIARMANEYKKQVTMDPQGDGNGA